MIASAELALSDAALRLECARGERKRARRELRHAAKRARRRESEQPAREPPSPERVSDTADGGLAAAPAPTARESAHACAQGPRPTMEDEAICIDDLCGAPLGRDACSLYAVLDGHGGARVAKIAKRVLAGAVRAHLELPAAPPRDGEGERDFDAGRRALLLAFEEAEAEIDAVARRGNWLDGTTACVALAMGGLLVVANVGDSRAVLGRADGSAVALSVDHKPDDEAEHRRIRDAGGLVTLFPGDCARVNGDLALSRALGDVRWKAPCQHTPAFPARYVQPAPPRAASAAGSGACVSAAMLPRACAPTSTAHISIVSATPDIECVRLLPGDDVLIVACDGLWDVMTDAEAIGFARTRLKRGVPLAQTAHELVRVALARGSMDNVTIVLVRFGDDDAGDGGDGGGGADPFALVDGQQARAPLEAFGPAQPAGYDGRGESDDNAESDDAGQGEQGGAEAKAGAGCAGGEARST